MTFDQFIEEMTTLISNANPDDLAATILILTGLVTAAGVFALINYLGTAIGFAKIFKKADEKGWKAFIPIFNVYTRFKISWNVKAFWIWIMAMVLAFLAPYFGDGVIVSLIGFAASIVGIVFVFKVYYNFARAFGKGVGTAVLLYFFPFIMSLVLGFGKAEYVRNPLNPEM